MIIEYIQVKKTWESTLTNKDATQIFKRIEHWYAFSGGGEGEIITLY